MSTNDDKSEDKTEDKPVTEDDLRAAKYEKEEVDTEKSEDETSETDEADNEESEETTEEESEEQSEETFTKKFPHIKGDTPEEYAKNLEAAYDNSTAEFHKLRSTKSEEKSEDEEEDSPLSYTELYVKQELDKKIVNAFTDLKKDYPQVTNEAEYEKFVSKVEVLSKVALAENRVEEPADLYNTAAVLLGWEKQNTPPDDKEKLAMAMKDGASVSKSSNGTKSKAKSASKVTDAEVATYRKMNPSSTISDTEIRKELEPHK